jgi:PAS domain S-box-containing protein
MKRISVLFLEDNLDDAELCLHYLKKSGYEVVSEVVSDPTRFRDRIGEGAWDVVIADYNLGQFTALDALEYCKERGLDLPFIVLTGMGSEELAVESIRLGALDYLRKDAMKFIGHRLDHALKDWQNRQEIQKLTRRIQDLARFPETNPNPVIRVESSGRISYLNPAATQFLREAGATTEDILKVFPLDFEREIRPLIGTDRIIRGKEKQVGDRCFRFTFSSFAELDAVQVNAEDITERKQAEEALQASEARYRAIFDTNQDVMIVTDSQRRIIDINEKALQKIFGYSKEEILGQTSRVLFPSKGAFDEFRETFYRQGRTGLIGTTLKRKAGETFPAETAVTPIGDDRDQASYFLEVHRDISDAVKLRRVLREKKAIETILAGSPVGIFIIDETHTVIYWNRLCEEITGLSAREMVGTRNQWKAFYDHDRRVAADYIIDGEADKMLQAYRTEGMKTSRRVEGAWEMELHFEKLAGKERHLLFTVSPIVDEHGKTIAAIEIMQDISVRKRAEEQNILLSRRLLSVAEETSKRLARDLHDELGQALTALHFGMEVLHQTLPDDLVSQKKRCTELIRLIEQVSDTTRNIISELRPAMLDHLGLLPTLEWYVEDFRKRMGGLSVEFEAIGLKQRLDAEVETVLYRIIQEGLHNVVKHANAKNVSIHLTHSYPDLILTIKDDGVGFNQNENTMSSGARHQGIGILGMRERIASVGGRLEVRSKPGRGTLIRAEVPVGGMKRDGKDKGTDS